MTEQKEFVDFNVGLGDTGEDNLAAIQPNSDGEGATQVVLRRPSENLRERTETLRDIAGELLYYRDYSHLLVEYTGGTITWNGAAPGAPPLGKISVTAGNFIVTPMLAPYQATKGTLFVGTPASNGVIYTVAANSYATHGMNAVTIKHLHSAAAGSVSVTISVGPIKRIVVTLNTSNIAHNATAVQTALAIAIAADTDLAGRLVITTNAIPSVAVIALAETRLDTTADDEKHVIAGSDIQTLTTTTPLQPGMGIAIWYKYVIEPAGFGADPKGGLAGGRAESSGDRGTSAIPAAALFVTHISPDKIPGAIPLCRVGYNGQLIWYDGTRLEAGESFQFKSPTSVASIALAAHVALQASVLGAATVGYNGSGPWADGVTAVTASTVETAIDEIVADLADMTATLPGAIRIGVDAPTIFGTALTALGGGGALTTNTTIRAALSQLHSSAIARRAFTAVCTDGTNSVGGDINVVDVVPAINTLAATGGTYLLRRGAYNASTDFTTSKNTHLIGEDVTKVTLSLTKTGNVTFLGSSLNDQFSFENIFLKGHATALHSYLFTGGAYTLRNCRATAGSFFVQPAAAIRLDVDGLVIDDDTLASVNVASVYLYRSSASTDAVTGMLRRLRVTAVPSGSSGTIQKYALAVINIGTKAASRNYEPLVIEDSIFDISAGFGNVGASDGAIALIQAAHQPQIYRNCVFRCNQSNASITPTVMQIIDSTNIEFDNCTFIQDGYGKVLSVSGDSNHIRFRGCKFYTSTVAVNYPEIGVVCNQALATDPGQNIVFEDCYVEIRFGTVTGSTTTRRIEIGTVAGAATGNGSYTIDGFHVDLNYANTSLVADYTFSLSAGAIKESTMDASNITLDLRGKRLAGANTRFASLESGFGVHVLSGLFLKNVTEPDTTAGATNLTCALVDLLSGVTVSGGSLEGTPAVSNVSAWKALFNVSVGSLTNFTFYLNSSQANKGRCILADYANITYNIAYAATFATGEDTPGWFLFSDNTNSVICNNSVATNSSAEGYFGADNHAFISLGAGARSNLVSNNVIVSSFPEFAFKAITVFGANNTITGNSVTCTTSVAGETALIKLTSTSTGNVVTANTSRNEGTGTQNDVLNAGTSTTAPNRVFGNTSDKVITPTVKVISALVGTFKEAEFVAAAATPGDPPEYISSVSASKFWNLTLDAYVPDGAVITEVRASIQMTLTTTPRTSLVVYFVDILGGSALVSGPVFAAVGLTQQYISSGVIAAAIQKVNKTCMVSIKGSSAAGDNFYGIEITYTTPKFYVD